MFRVLGAREPAQGMGAIANGSDVTADIAAPLAVAGRLAPSTQWAAVVGLVA
jgi:hypothetical protein